MRVTRVVGGAVLLVLAMPVLLGGAGLWVLDRHSSPDGAFTAAVERIDTPGYAVVVPDLDALMRSQVGVASGGRGTLRVTARTPTGPAFVGLASSARLSQYLAGVAHSQVHEVRLATGPLPVRTSRIAGWTPPPARPLEQGFWQRVGDLTTGTLTVPTDQVREERPALVVMTEDGRAPLSVDLTAGLTPRWLAAATWSLLVAGTVLLLLGLAALVWPVRLTRPGTAPAGATPGTVPPAAVPLGAGRARGGAAAGAAIAAGDGGPTTLITVTGLAADAAAGRVASVPAARAGTGTTGRAVVSGGDPDPATDVSGGGRISGGAGHGDGGPADISRAASAPAEAILTWPPLPVVPDQGDGARGGGTGGAAAASPGGGTGGRAGRAGPGGRAGENGQSGPGGGDGGPHGRGSRGRPAGGRGAGTGGQGG